MYPDASKNGLNILSESDIARLRSEFAGQVIPPGDPAYDAGRVLFYGGFENRRPAVIIRAASDQDVARAVSLARETGLPLAVRSGGHSPAGLSLIDGGILLDLKGLNNLHIDPEGCTAWAESGLTTGEYTSAAAEYGLATGFGDTGTVGIGGLTLGGGVGYLVRKYGLTIDNLLAADLVTADGQLLRVDSGNHPDLFWAIRGGGGNFGVVTRFLFRLQEVPSMLGGLLVLPATAETLAGFVDAASSAPEELSTIANVMVAPPMPFLPPELTGQLVILGILAYAGPVEEGEKALAPFRALAKPLADMVRPIRYTDLFMPEEGDYHPAAASRNLYVDRIGREEAERIIDNLQASDAPFRVAQVRVLGGAAARVPVEATAYPHRQAPIMVNLAAFYNGPEERAAREAWVEDFARSLNQGYLGSYVNFLGIEGEGRAQVAYPGPTWDRLVAVKRRYDPENLFRGNNNVPPDGAGPA